MSRILLLLISITILLTANEKVVLQLKWFHQFQFAGYYAAKEMGFYKELGLDVEIRQRDLKYNNIQQVIDNEAQYGIADSVLLLYKSKNEPIVIISPIFQHSPSVLISLKNNGIESVYDLNNKDMLFYDNDTDGFTILAMLKKLGIKPNIIRGREKNDYKKLMNNKVDTFPAYLSNEPFYFTQKNIDINVIDPRNYGFDLYGDMLFTNKIEAKNNPDRVRKFKEATLKGWAYALENQDEIINLIHKKYNPKKSIEHLTFEAKAIDRVISKETIPLGTVDKGRIKYIHSLYKDYGLTDNTLDVKDFIFDDYEKEFSKIDFTKEEKEYLKQKGVIKVQNMTSLAPYNFNENNQARGYSIDYLKLMSKYMNIKLEFISGKTWAENLEMLKNNTLDIIPQIAKNNEREKFIGFTNFKHLDYIPSIVVRKNSSIKSINDLDNKTVAVLNKSFIHKLLESNFPKVKLHLLAKLTDMLNAVSSGKADAAINDLATMQFYIQSNWLSNLKTIKIQDSKIIKITNLYMGVSKENTLLKSILEKVNDSLPFDEVLKLKKKWTSNEIIKTIFSNEELSYLSKKEELNMCIDPEWMPFEKIENNEHVGITSDYIKLFEKKLPIPIKLVHTKNWLETIDFAKNRNCDFITSMSQTKERQKNFNFTKSLMNVPIVIATKINKPFVNNLSDVKDKTLAIVKGFAYKSILKTKYPNIKLVEVASAKDGLEKVFNDEVYGFIGIFQAVGYNIQVNYFDNIKIAGKLDDSWSFPMATRNDEPLLNDIFNKLIDNISPETQNSILNKWISVKYQESIDYTKLVWVSIFFLIIIIIVIYKNKSIKKINQKMQNYIDVIDQNILVSETDKNGIIISVSQAFCNMSEYTKNELIGKNHNILRHKDMDEKIFKEMWETIIKGNIWKGEIKNRRKNGKSYWVKATISPNFDKRGFITGYTSLRQDITDKKKIEQLSITDELTSLYNKRHFNIILEKEINSIKRDEQRIGYIMFDVDHFKQYNDNYGHQKGDEVLSSIGKVLKECCKRSNDTPFRIGGEEFAIIFHPHFKESAIEFANIVKNAIEELKIEHKFNSASDYITVSIGLYTALWKEVKSSHEIYKLTDEALYKAKKSGRNTIHQVND